MPVVPMVAPPAAPTPMPIPDLAFEEPSGPTVSLRRGRARRPPRRWGPILVVALIVGLMGVGFYFLIDYRLKHGGRGIVGLGQDFDQYNFTLVAPDKPWVQDVDLQNQLKVKLAWKRSKPANFMALHYQDYEKRLPGKAESLDSVLIKLRDYFQGFIWQPREPSTPENLVANGTLAGQKAVVIEFQGERDQVAYEGECYILEWRGYVYWLLTWTPAGQKDQVADEWASLREGFTLMNHREGWQPLPRKTTPIKGKNYALAYPSEVWKPLKVDGYDAAARVVLIGTDPQEARKFHAGQAALIQVLELAKSDDLKEAVKAAREHLVAQLKLEGLGDVTPQILSDKGGEVNRLADIGKVRGHLIKMRVKVSEGTFDRFMVLAITNLDDAVVVVRCECAYKRRDFWEAEFAEVIQSFRTEAPPEP